MSSRIAAFVFAMGLAAAGTAAFAAGRTLEPTPAEMTSFRDCVNTAEDALAGSACDGALSMACDRRHGQPGTTIAISECGMTANAAWDRLLNEAWPRALRGKTAKAQGKLRAAQRLWISLRKADCDAVYEINIEGTIRSPAFASCMTAVTRDRFFHLRNLAFD